MVYLRDGGDLVRLSSLPSSYFQLGSSLGNAGAWNLALIFLHHL